MRIFHGVILLMFGSACALGPQDEGEPADNAPLVQTTNAIIVDTLPVDGCSYRVLVADIEYAPDVSSRAMVADFVEGIGETPARIAYQLTGDTTEVECGWGSSVELPEIVIFSIEPAAEAD